MGRLILAGLLAGLAMFVWSSIAHTVLPLGEMGIQSLPNDKTVTAPLQAAAGARPGLYMYPNPGPDADHHSEAGRKAMTEAIKTNPSGILMYHPPGRPSDMGPYLIGEVTIEGLQGLLLAFVLAKIAGAFATRLVSAAAIGLAAAVTTNGSYAIWYGFPTDYTAGAMITTFVGYVLAGAVAAWWLGRKQKAAEA